jgi:hypothetical protein
VLLSCEAFHPFQVGGVYGPVVSGGVGCVMSEGCAEVGRDFEEGLFPFTARKGGQGWQAPEQLCR